MANYVGAGCPVCEKTFTGDDDIVVCPVCGTPHHRACYQKLGRCACEELHTQGHEWQPPNPSETAHEPEPPPRGESALCPACGAQNPEDSIFCRTCGIRLGQQPSSGYSAASSAYSAAFGGVSPDEEIAGVSARDLALYVGTGSHYFLPRFRAIDSGMPVSLNTPAFLNFLYFFYRKMYSAGLILLGLYLIMQIPTLFYTYEFVGYFMQHFDTFIANPNIGSMGTFLSEMYALQASFTPQRYLWTMTAIPIARYLTIVVSVLLTLFGNRIYLFCAVRSIRRIRALCEQASGGFDDRIYTEMLARRGRTSFGIVAVVITGLFAACVLVSCIFMIPYLDYFAGAAMQ